MEIIVKKMKILYFGIYAPTAPRDKIYLEGLKLYEVEVIRCTDSSPGVSKYFHLARQLRKSESNADIIWVGYLSGMLVPLARIFAPNKRIIFNALNSMYETYILDREKYSKFNVASWLIWFVDFLSFHMADTSLVESIEQKKFISRFFLVNPKKLEVVYTGVDESVFFLDPSIEKRDKFTVVFRGLFLPATGVEYVLEAAKILKDEGINFVIIGWGERSNYVRQFIEENGLNNVEWIHWFLQPKELREKMLSAHVMLGQFSSHERMNRTIQNKTFEAMALGMPYITRDSRSNREILTDGTDCLFVKPNDSRGLADKIIELKLNAILRKTLSSGVRRLFETKLTKNILSGLVYNILLKLTLKYKSRYL